LPTQYGKRVAINPVHDAAVEVGQRETGRQRKNRDEESSGTHGAQSTGMQLGVLRPVDLLVQVSYAM
jgi:hypothetical protein